MFAWLILNWRAALAGIGALAAIAAGWTIYSRIKDSGRDEVRREIEIQDRRSENAAREGRGHVRACYDDGGVWDTSTGKCARR